jgi:hypothetical protein
LGWKTPQRAWLENTVNLANDLPVVFQVLDRFDAGYESETTVAVRKHLPV